MEKKKTNGKRGGQPGNRNAVKHGIFTSDNRQSDNLDTKFHRMARQTIRIIVG